MSANFRIGIQSYCFRKFLPLQDLIGCLKQVGLDYLELWPGHVSCDADKAQLQEVLDTLAANGISLQSYGQVKFTDDAEAARRVFEFCRMAGIKAVTADIDPQSVGLTERLCDDYDVNLAIHNHGRKHRYGHVAQLDELFAKTSKRFGLCLDAAWMLDAGEQPLAAVERYADRLYGVHLKDFTFDANGKPRDVIIGTGGLDLPELMRRLDRMDYDGYLSLEYEGDPHDPLPAVRDCLTAIRAAIEPLQSPPV